MEKPSFDRANERIRDLEFEILESKYHRDVFGSWYITIKTEPKIRLVWDGKDEELSIQKITDELFNDSPIWKTTWSKLKPSESDFKVGISKLQKQAV